MHPFPVNLSEALEDRSWALCSRGNPRKRRMAISGLSEAPMHPSAFESLPRLDITLCDTALDVDLACIILDAQQHDHHSSQESHAAMDLLLYTVQSNYASE